MANVHEFGIMDTAPLQNERYDRSEPDKYNCIQINDDFIEKILRQLETVDTYWHTLDRPENGLAYCGITLIPPNSMLNFLYVLEAQNNSSYEELQNLIKKAWQAKKFIIHYGI